MKYPCWGWGVGGKDRRGWNCGGCRGKASLGRRESVQCGHCGASPSSLFFLWEDTRSLTPRPNFQPARKARYLPLSLLLPPSFPPPPSPCSLKVHQRDRERGRERDSQPEMLWHIGHRQGTIKGKIYNVR